MVEHGEGTLDGVLGDEESIDGEAVDDDEAGPAMDFGLRLGAPVAAVAGYVLFVGPHRGLDLSPAASDLFIVNDTGAVPYLQIGVATLLVVFAGGLYYGLSGREPYDGHRSDLAVGATFAPAAVMLLQFALILIEMPINKLLVGDVAGGLFLFVVELVVVAVLVGSSLGIIVAMIFFGVYLGIPSFVGAYAGCVVGAVASPE